jgi:hypothetical protein
MPQSGFGVNIAHTPQSLERKVVFRSSSKTLQNPQPSILPTLSTVGLRPEFAAALGQSRAAYGPLRNVPCADICRRQVSVTADVIASIINLRHGWPKHLLHPIAAPRTVQRVVLLWQAVLAGQLGLAACTACSPTCITLQLRVPSGNADTSFFTCTFRLLPRHVCMRARPW